MVTETRVTAIAGVIGDGNFVPSDHAPVPAVLPDEVPAGARIDRLTGGGHDAHITTASGPLDISTPSGERT